MLDARDAVLATVKDIEDIVTIGKKSCVCPYYATRRAVKQSQVSLREGTAQGLIRVACHFTVQPAFAKECSGSSRHQPEKSNRGYR